MFFYEPLSATACVSVLLYLAFLIGMNELSRLNKWVGAVIFIALPVVLTVFVWPHTAVEGTGAGTWFQWVKTYSCLAGAILGWLIVYFPAFQKKYIVCIPPIIFAINILEACIRDFQLTGVNGIVDGYMVVGGPWNVMNGIAGILNAICICGFFGIIVSRGKKKDYVWPDQLWFWIDRLRPVELRLHLQQRLRPLHVLRPGASGSLHHPGVLHQARRLRAAPRPHACREHRSSP